MSKINIKFILGIILLALIFQKNTNIGIFIIAIYAITKIPKRRKDVNKKLIENNEINTKKITKAIDKGFLNICKTMIALKNPDQDFDLENDPNNDFEEETFNTRVYRY